MTQTVRKTEERIEGASGMNLFVRSWRPEGTVGGVVAIVPGFNAHSSYYAWAGEQLAADGLAVLQWICAGEGDRTANDSTSTHLQTTSAMPVRSLVG
jgi:alpha-beta hydrolase superfamily lysophospholipase